MHVTVKDNGLACSPLLSLPPMMLAPQLHAQVSTVLPQTILSLNSFPPPSTTGHVIYTAITDLQGLVEGMEGVGTHQEERKDGAICRG